MAGSCDILTPVTDPTTSPQTTMTLCGDLPTGSLEALFQGYGISIHWVPPGAPIPGSHWGEPEAGILASTSHLAAPPPEPRGQEQKYHEDTAALLFVREDTPVHSALHEGGHLICMDSRRRSTVDTDAGGEDTEECGVCYLQILLAHHLPGVGSEKLCRDMDTWGYSFRLGSTQAWFREDAQDARQWLIAQGLLRPSGEIVWHLRS